MAKETQFGQNFPKKIFYPNFGYFTLTFEPETLESQ